MGVFGHRLALILGLAPWGKGRKNGVLAKTRRVHVGMDPYCVLRDDEESCGGVYTGTVY